MCYIINKKTYNIYPEEKMVLIERGEVRGKQRYSKFLCPVCGKVVEKQEYSGLRYTACSWECSGVLRQGKTPNRIYTKGGKKTLSNIQIAYLSEQFKIHTVKELDSLLGISVQSLYRLATKYNIPKNRIYHGYSRKRIYNIWVKIIQRCYNPKDTGYKNYGARGIAVCDEWRIKALPFILWSFENGYSDELTIDRIDNDGNYEPSNCRWANSITQCNNKRDNVKFVFQGELKTLSEISRIIGINRNTLYARFSRGYPAEKMFYPVSKKRKRDSMGKFISILHGKV